MIEISVYNSNGYRGLRMTKNAYFSLLAHNKQLLLVIFCGKTAGTGREGAP